MLFVLCWVFSSCVSYIDTRRMNVTVDNNSGQIMNLKFAGDSEEKLYMMANKMLGNVFLNNSGTEYGYYDVRYEINAQSGDFGRIILYIPILWPLPFLGVPTGVTRFQLVAHFYIFDANGDLVKHYSNASSYSQAFGLYYNGGFASKRGANEFSKLFDAIFIKASSDSAEINEKLETIGQISGDNTIEVQARIAGFFREKPFLRNPI